MRHRNSHDSYLRYGVLLFSRSEAESWSKRDCSTTCSGFEGRDVGFGGRVGGLGTLMDGWWVEMEGLDGQSESRPWSKLYHFLFLLLSNPTRSSANQLHRKKSTRSLEIQVQYPTYPEERLQYIHMGWSQHKARGRHELHCTACCERHLISSGHEI